MFWEPEESQDKPMEQRGPSPVTLTNRERSQESGRSLKLGLSPVPDHRPHKCNICEQSFEQRSYLNNISVYTGQKTHKYSS